MTEPATEPFAGFFLGRKYDLAARKALDERVIYDPRDLTTHGVVVGMTGSGKTGLCISLLEEAALAGLPCIMIDPKGDLTNLLLQFPDLKPEDFARWLNPDDARQKGVPLNEYAQRLADDWRKGLESSGRPLADIARLKDAAEWRVYTPGSEAGLPVSVLRNFAAPRGKVSREALNQKIDATTTALLGLAGIAADPVQSREHILIAQLLLASWGKGKDLDLTQLINQVQQPPIRTIGAFDVDTFYPEKDRLRLAVALNNILAAPGFSTWISGEPLDLGRMIGSGAKPRQLVFYIAHLEDSQRLFFLTLLLEEILSWTRKQAGTSGLRAIVYMDEVYGYLPPHPANPPTKIPLMTLLKQARAFGVGILLATQNPVDLDYKALSNAGTWFIGKLQTERDKARLLDGLEVVAAESGSMTDRAHLESTIAALSNRIFLMHNVHRGAPILFQSRWALSFLRGPLTRDQVGLLMEDARKAEPPPEAPAQAATLPTTGPGGDVLHPSAPVLPADVPQYYLAIDQAAPEGTPAALIYRPRLLGWAEVAFVDKKRGIERRQNLRLLAEAPALGGVVNWATAERITETLAAVPQPDAAWAEAPDSLASGKKLTALKKTLVEHLFNNARQTVLVNDDLDLIAEPGEDLIAFQKRCLAAAEEAVHKGLEEERAKIAPKFAALGAPMPAEEMVIKSSSWLDSLWPFGKPEAKPEPKGKDAKALSKLQDEYSKRRQKVVDKGQAAAKAHEELALTLRKTAIQVTHFGVAWAPFWQAASPGGSVQRLPAYRRM